MQARWLVGLFLVSALGCSSQRFAPVSGRVTLNGAPLANALVSFNPIPKEGSSEAGPGSIGTTNDNGEYTLRVTPDQPGALVGKHRVAITGMNLRVGESDTRQPNAGRPLTTPIPRRYNDRTELTCDVPAEGTDHANFDLHSP